MRVRAKFQLSEIRYHAGSTGKTFVFRPQYAQSVPEDQRFNLYTPSGEFTMFVCNPPVEEQFKLGDF